MAEKNYNCTCVCTHVCVMVCVCMCVCYGVWYVRVCYGVVYTLSWAYVHLCVPLQSPEKDSGSLPPLLSALF